jgi:transcription-repair coupling factor (superfamily II helicase)
VDSERLRLEAYQKLSTASSPNAKAGQIDAVLEELIDRYGEPPRPVLNLIAVSRLRLAAQKAGLGEVVAMGSNLRLAPAILADSVQVRLQRMYPGSKYHAAPKVVTVPLPRPDGEAPEDGDLIAWVASLLGAIFPAPEPAEVEASA